MAKATEKTEQPKKAAGVVKRMYSLPRGLYNHVVKRSKEIAKQEGKRPNASGFLAKLVFQDKFNNSTTPQPTK